MTVLDAFAVIAYLRNEPAAGQVRPLLTAGEGALTAVGVAEVLDHLVRLGGVDEEDAVLDVAQLGLLEATAVDTTIGVAAGRLRARYYHRVRCPVSMADCVAAESARSRDEALATADPDLLTVCHRESIAVIALPSSDGRRWKQPS